MAETRSDLTVMLNAALDGDTDSGEALYERVYGELRRLAGVMMPPEGSAQTIQATVLVHEVWLKLAGRESPWESRGHFFSIAAKAMRCILIDHVRARRTQRRGGDKRVTLDGIALALSERSTDLIALDEALIRLSEADSRKGQVVELRFFGGLTIPETAEVLDVSHATVERDWLFAKAWLKRAVEEQEDSME